MGLRELSTGGQSKTAPQSPSVDRTTTGSQRVKVAPRVWPVRADGIFQISNQGAEARQLMIFFCSFQTTEKAGDFLLQLPNNGKSWWFSSTASKQRKNSASIAFQRINHCKFRLKQILWRKLSEFSVEEHSLVRTECQEHMLLIFSLCQRKSHSTRTNQMLQLHSERMNHLWIQCKSLWFQWSTSQDIFV